jgi:AAA domain, putative AbiEii toxin, Type IV TA system/AAA ATPase domain
MPRSNGAAEDAPKTPLAIASLSVSGFKSIAEPQTIEVRPLTLLAGANSSGKSSMMQPLLLLKQTLEAPYDPGPLLLDGPNVKFTSASEFRSSWPNKKTSGDLEITLGISSGLEFAAVFQATAGSNNLNITHNSFLFNEQRIDISRTTSAEAVLRALSKRFTSYEVFVENLIMTYTLRFFPSKFLFAVALSSKDRGSHFQADSSMTPLSFMPIPGYETIDQSIRDTIHLPGLRGNPERIYPVAAIGPRFPGTFENYVASLIASWSPESSSKIGDLSEDLKSLGLTWKVEVKSVSDTQVELRVGRMPRPRQGGAHDLVNIADVGFGVSQTLPVVVALRAALPGQLVYIEQPEIHLHPRAQVAMARLLVNAANRGVRVVAETHSSLILLAVQTLVAEGVIEPGLVGLNWFLRDEKTGTTRIKTAELDEAGRFGDWPEDFDEVALEAENRYLSAAENRLAKG